MVIKNKTSLMPVLVSTLGESNTKLFASENGYTPGA
jgi:hypothetical protein